MGPVAGNLASSACSVCRHAQQHGCPQPCLCPVVALLAAGQLAGQLQLLPDFHAPAVTRKTPLLLQGLSGARACISALSYTECSGLLRRRWKSALPASVMGAAFPVTCAWPQAYPYSSFHCASGVFPHHAAQLRHLPCFYNCRAGMVQASRYNQRARKEEAQDHAHTSIS